MTAPSVPSEFAKAFAVKHLQTTLTVGAIRLMTNLDAELQEAREVLEGLQTFWLNEGDDVPDELHWCDPDQDCTDQCSRARTLLSKLRIEP